MSKENYGRGAVRQLKSGRFQARLSMDGNRIPLGTFATKELAEKALAAALVARSRLQFQRGLTFADFGFEVHKEHWRKARLSGRDPDRYAERTDFSRWDFWIAKSWPYGKLPPEAMDRSHFEHLIAHLLEHPTAKGTPAKNQTISNVWILVRRVAKAARKEGLWTTDHLCELEAPKRIGEYVQGANPLTTKEMFAVLHCKEYEPHQTCAFALKMYSGLRAGEMASLLKTDFHSVWNDHCDCHGLEAEDRLLPHVMVTKSWDRPTPKNEENRRVWLCQDVVPLILEWNRYLDSLPPKLKRRYSKHSERFWGRKYKRGYDWGWASKYDRKRNQYYPGCKEKAGITRPVTEHQLRDTHASHLISGTFGRRWSAEEVAKQLGHSSTWVTERYGTLLDRAMAFAIRETPGLSSQDQAGTAQKFAPVIQLPVSFKARAVSNERVQMAAQLLAAYDNAKDSLSDAAADEIERTALQLADSVLEAEDVRLAHRVLMKDRLLLTHGVELARVLMRTADTAEASDNSPADVVRLATNDGRFKPGPDARRWNKGGTPYLENRPGYKRPGSSE